MPGMMKKGGMKTMKAGSIKVVDQKGKSGGIKKIGRDKPTSAPKTSYDKNKMNYGMKAGSKAKGY